MSSATHKCKYFWGSATRESDYAVALAAEHVYGENVNFQVGTERIPPLI